MFNLLKPQTFYFIIIIIQLHRAFSWTTINSNNYLCLKCDSYVFGMYNSVTTVHKTHTLYCQWSLSRSLIGLRMKTYWREKNKILNLPIYYKCMCKIIHFEIFCCVILKVSRSIHLKTYYNNNYIFLFLDNFMIIQKLSLQHSKFSVHT